MEGTQVVSYAKTDTILEENIPAVIVLFPNYEDRTKGIIREFLNSKKRDDTRIVKYLLFCLKNKSNNNMLLEDLKEQNIDETKLLLKEECVYEYWLEYPSNFSPNALKAPIQALLEELKNDNHHSSNILFDISTVPKSILFQLCESTKEFIQKDLLCRVFFAYCQPKEYSKVPYAQDIGLLKGLFSGEALHFTRDQAIHTIIFPSRTGHEGKLLCDTLDSISKNTNYSVYFPVHKDNYMDSLDVMQANQSLIDRDSYLNYYYCTLDDAIKSIDELIHKEYRRISQIVKMHKAQMDKGAKENNPMMPQVYLIAPFGAKAFLPVAYFELLKLKSVDPEYISVEIANVKGFQYTSSYSLGGDGGRDGKEVINSTCFEINGGLIKNGFECD